MPAAAAQGVGLGVSLTILYGTDKSMTNEHRKRDQAKRAYVPEGRSSYSSKGYESSG